MNLRAVTINLPKDTCSVGFSISVQKLIDETKLVFLKEGISVRTFRLNLPPFNSKETVNKQKILGVVEDTSRMADSLGIRWFNVPFDLIDNSKESLQLSNMAFEIIKRFDKTFINLIVCSEGVINFEAIKKAGKFIKDVSTIDKSGYNNFRVGVSCNPVSDTPFFPFTFSSGKGFSIALELPEEFIRIIKSSKSKDLVFLRNEFIRCICPFLKKINSICIKLEEKTSYTFKGIDVALAPFPSGESSVAYLIELLGVEQQGANGTLFITAYLTDILRMLIKESGIRSVGFNGVMYSLLEDDYMGKRNTSYSVDSFISYSAVCGCGLDMVPLPGDVFEEEISSIILDVASLSSVLNKPLGVRILPLPSKKENEFTTFDMDFLFNTRVMKMKKMGFLGTFDKLNIKKKNGN